MITYSEQLFLDKPEHEPKNLGEWFIHQLRPSYGTYDYAALYMMGWMYRCEAEAANDGATVEFSFRVQTGKSSYSVSPRATLAADPITHLLTVSAHLYTGLVLADREENYYDDSDFYAIIWSPAEQRCRRVDYDSTRYAGGGNCRVDATPEVRRAAAQWLADWYRDQATRLADREAHAIKKGRFVRVVADYKPRGVDKVPAYAGDYAYIFWEGEDRYSGCSRYGIEFVGGDRDGQRTFVTGSHRFEVLNPVDYMRSAEDIEAHAQHIAESDRPAVYRAFSRCAIVV